MKKVLQRLFESRKFWIAVATVILVAHASRLGVDPEKVFFVGLALIAGFAVADFGKEKK